MVQLYLEVFNRQYRLTLMSYSFANTFGKNSTSGTFLSNDSSSLQSRTLQSLIRQSNQSINRPSQIPKKYPDLDTLNDKMVSLINELSVLNKENRYKQSKIQSVSKRNEKTREKPNKAKLKERVRTIESQFVVTEEDQSSSKKKKSCRKLKEGRNEVFISDKIKSITKKIDNYQSKIYLSSDPDWFTKQIKKKNCSNESNRVQESSVFKFYDNSSRIMEKITFSNNKETMRQRIGEKMKLSHIAEAFIKQISLDQELRKGKKELSKIFDEKKWVYLSFKLRQNGIQIPYENIEQIFTAKFEESDPFYSVTVESEDDMREVVDNLVKAFKQSEQNWRNSIRNRMRREQYEKLQINEIIKGEGIRLDQLTVLINSVTKSIYKCRDITLVYNRLKEQKGLLTKKLMKQKLIHQ